MTEFVIANRKQEMAFFQLMLENEVSHRVLLVTSPEQKGKTKLLKGFSVQCDARKYSCAFVNLGDFPSVEEVMHAVTRELGEEHFPSFEQEFRKNLSLPPLVMEMRDNRLHDNNTVSLNPSIQIDGRLGQTQRNLALTDALFTDLSNRSVPTMLLLDSFDTASAEVRRWVQVYFMREVQRREYLRAVIAGRELPSVNSGNRQSQASLSRVPPQAKQALHPGMAEHEGCCIWAIDPIIEDAAWYPFAQKLFPNLPQGHVEIICQLTKDPGQIVEHIHTLGRLSP